MNNAQRFVRKAAGPAFLLLAIALAGLAIWRDRHDIGDGLHRMPIVTLIASFLLGVGGVAMTWPMWRAMSHGLDVDLPRRPSARVFFVGQLGKYVPGSIWPVVAQMELGRRHGVARSRMFATGAFTMVVNVTVGAIIAVALLPFVSSEASHRFWWLTICLPVLIAMLHPRVLMWTTNKLLRLLHRTPFESALPARAVLRTALFGTVSWLLLGGHVYALVSGLGASGLRAFVASVAASCLAIVAGILFVPAPAGAGVREVAFVVALASVLGRSEAILVALLSRVVLIVVDFTLAALAARQRAASDDDEVVPSPEAPAATTS